MASPNPPSRVLPYALGGAAGALVGAIASFVLTRGAPAGADAPVTETPVAPLPSPGLPVYSSLDAAKELGIPMGTPTTPPATLGAAAGSIDVPITAHAQFPDAPAPYFLQLYTVRFVPAQGMWGQWDGPTAFRGHVVQQGSWFTKEMWSSPDDDMVAYLDAIATSNPEIGFWIARKVPVLSEVKPASGVFSPADHTPDQIGPPGPWFSGRFGDLENLNPTLDAITRKLLEFLGSANADKADVTLYTMVPIAGGVTVPAEIKLA